MDLFVASTALIIILLIMGLLLGTAIVFLFTFVPYIPTPMRVVRKMVDLAKLRGCERIYDLGCGDARLLIESKRRHPEVHAIGYEISPIPYLLAHLRKALKRKDVHIKFKSFFGENLADADLIFLYQMPHTMKKLEEKLQRELRPGTRVVSHGFRFYGREPVKTLHIGKKPTILGFAHPQRDPVVYLYEW
jgi:SAM-dependent methyltransferase